MSAPIERCHVCGFTEENPNLHDAGGHWTRPGLCKLCAGLGFDWTPCRPCGLPVVWAMTVNGKRMPVNCLPKGMEPNQVLHHDGREVQARHAHPEYLRLNVTRESRLRSGVSHHADCPMGHAMRRGR